ncbi:hypothetical protein F9K73_13595 [Brucella intermedia]|uniref:hypothetical protein n=1 Tax=Brucella intermedia TaxID=94625 RepID=UPI00124E39D3|nr:hypothetical protein [Brucella intermedia]KAB2720947.1 hypothetical protein F9K73_13595 [Brucella intermedia]
MNQLQPIAGANRLQKICTLQAVQSVRVLNQLREKLFYFNAVTGAIAAIGYYQNRAVALHFSHR